MKYLLLLLTLSCGVINPKYQIGECVIPSVGRAIKIINIDNDKYVVMDSAGYDIFKITYCENCRKHLNKELVDFVSYKDFHVN